MKKYKNLGLEIRHGERQGEGWLWPVSDSHCWRHLNKSRFAFLPKHISEIVKNKNIVIQAGGNCGVYPKQYSEIFNTVVTFEPDYLNFICLTYNVPNTNVFKFQACLGNENVPLGLKPHEKLGESNSGAHKTSLSGNIPQVRIDDLNMIPDLIHLDLEGFEGPALEGALTTIQKYKPVIVLEEHGFGNEYGYSQDFITKLLTELNYTNIAKFGDDVAYIHKDY